MHSVYIVYSVWFHWTMLRISKAAMHNYLKGFYLFLGFSKINTENIIFTLVITSMLEKM